jgi:pimeloyl-ACP methyl ester carboxylesterase
MHIEKNGVLTSKTQKPIVYDVYHNDSHTPKPIVIFCHGYKGFKDWGAWHLVAKAFADRGFFFLKFNFSDNGGTVQQPIDFPDLEAFAQNNYSKELEDLERVIHYVRSTKKYANEVDVQQVNFIGHSRGGGIVLIKGEENIVVKKVVTWAGVSDYRIRFQEGTESFKNFKKTGRTFVENGRTKQQMPHDWQFYENFIENEDRLTIQRAASHLKKPWLIIHGDKDTSVTLDEAKLLHSWNSKSKLEILNNADHVFGAKHPWDKETLPSALKTVVELTCNFLKKI